MTTRAERRTAEDSHSPLLRRRRFWILGATLVLLFVLAIGAVIAKQVYDQATSAKTSLEQAMPLASKAADQLLAGDRAGAKETVAQLGSLTASARSQTTGDLWKCLEWTPIVGPNLHAVRTAAAVTDDLVQGALVPATALSLDALQPKNGAIDLSGITAAQKTVSQVQGTVDETSAELALVDHDALLNEVGSALTTLTGAVDELRPMLRSASDILGVLPEALGAEKPRHYLMIFQNNAESRGTGGNPAALVMIDVDKGKISIGQQAASGDFKNARPEPVIKLSPATEALYGDKVGRWISDATMTPDFTESANIVRAWWAEEFGTPIDGVVSFDPVALSYLLQATGPAVVPDEPVEVGGQEVRILDEPLTLTPQNAVPFLLNEVYWKYPPPVQDAIFAASARAVFGVLTGGSGDPKALVSSLTRAVDEGRLMYQPATEDEARLIGESKLSGRLPTSNEEATTLATYVNDFTESKLDYYLQLDLSASTTQCTAPDSPTFTITATLTNTVTPDQARKLPRSISPARFFEKGHIATNLAVYGPVGASQARVTVDGKVQTRSTFPHLGRPAVMVPVYNAPGQSHTVTVEFMGAKGGYGPLEVRHTPMVRETPLELKAPDCE